MRSLLDILVSLAGREDRSLEPEDALAAAQAYFERHPDRIEEIAPGYRLVKRQSVTEDHVRKRAEASAKVRAKKAEERYTLIIPVLKEEIRKDPKVTLRALAAKLDEVGPKPQRAERWSAAAVLYIMNKVGLSNESTEA